MNKVSPEGKPKLLGIRVCLLDKECVSLYAF